MSKPTTAEIETLYSKETAKLALLAQKLQVSKQLDRITQKRAEAADVDAKIVGLETNIESLCAKHLNLRNAYDKEDAEWKTKLVEIEKAISMARESDDSGILIDALKQEIKIATARPSILSKQIAAVNCLSALKLAEKELSKTLEIKVLISEMESELSILEDVVERGKKELRTSWGKDVWNHNV